ncbi:MAG: hypothetical protein AB8C84_12005 [Oligoflexales bacterium]
MKNFMLLTIGFEKPTPEIMMAWKQWFESIADKIVGKPAGLMNGREITKSGTKQLAWDLEATTGYVIIKAENIDEAEKIAATNPYITSIRVYEIMHHS